MCIRDRKEYAPDKWQHLTVSDLFPDMLRDAKVLVAKCTKDKIRIIGTVLEAYTLRAFFNASFTKARNANIITRAFEGTNLILDRRYALLALQVSYANVTNWVGMTDWALQSKIQLSVKIPRKVAGLTSSSSFFATQSLVERENNWSLEH